VSLPDFQRIQEQNFWGRKHLEKMFGMILPEEEEEEEEEEIYFPSC
jgi:hypothetical protein